MSNNKNAKIGEILDLEWEMFRSVNGDAITSGCQNNRLEFTAMRGGQFEAWSEACLDSYLEDLKQAKNDKRNLLREKYILMMEETQPREYEFLKAHLHDITEEKQQLAKEVNAEMIAQTAKLREDYPTLGKYGRPLYSSQDRVYVTSIETYQYGELRTYSMRTLHLLQEHMHSLNEQGISFAELVQENTFRSYGYQTLAEASEALEKQNAKKNS